MKKTIRKSLSIFLSLCMLLSVLSVGVFAEDPKDRLVFDCDSIEGNVAYFTVGDQTVSLTVSGASFDGNAINLTNGTLDGLEVTISDNYDIETMDVYVTGANGYRDAPNTTPDGNVLFGELVFPRGDTVLHIEPRGEGDDGNPDIFTFHFKDANIAEGKAIFSYYGLPMTLSFEGYDIPDDGTIELTRDEVYSLTMKFNDEFNPDEMHLYAMALDGYTADLEFDSNNCATFDGLVFPNEIYLSLDSFIEYICAVDSYDERFFDGETLYIESGDSVFVGFSTHPDNMEHRICPIYGFNYGIGEDNFENSLTSMGFICDEGYAEDFGIENEWLQGCYGVMITAPDELELGTRADLTYALYELPDNFDITDPFATLSFSDTPKVVENVLHVEVEDTWELEAGALVYSDLYEQEMYFDNQESLYLNQGETVFISFCSDFDRNIKHGVTPFCGFSEGYEGGSISSSGFDVVCGLAGDLGYNPELGYGIQVSAGDLDEGVSAVLDYYLYELSPDVDPWNMQEFDFVNTPHALDRSLHIEVNNFDMKPFAIDEHGLGYTDGGVIVMQPDSTLMFTFDTDYRCYLNGISPLVGFDAGEEDGELMQAGFGVEMGMPWEFETDFTDNFIIKLDSTGVPKGTKADIKIWLCELPEGLGPDDMFDLDTAPRVYEGSITVSVGEVTNGKTGDCEWNYDEQTKTLTISGEGAMADYDWSRLTPWRNFEINKVIVENGVTVIGNDAFMGAGAESVTIADSVTEIKTNAFNTCLNLATVTLPKNLKSVGAYAFADTKLKEVTIPESVETIDVCAFGYYYDEQADDDLVTDGFVIKGYDGSEAQKYANENNIKFVSLSQPLDYKDVKENAWYYDMVQYCAQKGYMGGYSNGNFGPADNLKRQDFVMILARIAKADLSKYENKTSKFSDVKKGSYYYSAVIWAVENGIIGGYNNGKFGVGDNITREQVATILYRFMGSPDVDNVDSTLAKFSDVKKISSYAKIPIAWAVQNGVISGMADGRVAPTEGASRAQIATIVMRMDEQGMFN